MPGATGAGAGRREGQAPPLRCHPERAQQASRRIFFRFGGIAGNHKGSPLRARDGHPRAQPPLCKGRCRPPILREADDGGVVRLVSTWDGRALREAPLRRGAAGRVGRDALIAPQITHTAQIGGRPQGSPLRAQDGTSARNGGPGQAAVPRSAEHCSANPTQDDAEQCSALRETPMRIDGDGEALFSIIPEGDTIIFHFSFFIFHFSFFKEKALPGRGEPFPYEKAPYSFRAFSLFQSLSKA